MASTLSIKNNIVRGAVYTLAAAVVFLVWVWGADSPSTSLNGDPRSTLSDIIYGRAHSPFVQRVLVPLLTRSLHSLLPADTWDSTESFFLSIPKFQREMDRLGWEREYLSEYLIALGIACASLVGFVFLLRRFWSLFYATSEDVTNTVPLLGLGALPPFFHVGTHYIYDFPNLFLFTLGLYFMVRSRWGIFYAVYILGCMNKETTLFLSIAFLLVHARAMNPPLLIRHFALQLGIWIPIKAALMLVFMGNPGRSLEFHLFGNIDYLLHGYTATMLLVATTILTVISYNFRQKHFLLQRLCWLLAPFGLSMFIFAAVTEVRDLLEIYPIFLFLVLHTLLFSLFMIPYRLAPGTPHSNTER